jgi:hypothetical protein
VCWATTAAMVITTALQGEVEAVEFTTYVALVERFIGEIHELWRIEDEED